MRPILRQSIFSPSSVISPLEEAQDRLHQRGLARAVFSEQADDLPLREAEADILQRGLISVFFRDMF